MINEYDKHRCQKYVELKGQCHEIVIPTIFYIVLSNTYTVCLAKYEKAFNIKNIELKRICFVCTVSKSNTVYVKQLSD